MGRRRTAQRPRPATCARTRRSARPTRRAPLDGAARRSSACPRSSSTSRSRRPVATRVVRLTDVAPDGTSAQVSAGDPQPDPPPLARTARSRSSPGRVEEVRRAPAAGRLSVRRRATGSASRWRRRPGRSSGRRRSRRRSSSIAVPRRRRGSILPVVPPAGGPGDVAGPGLQDDAARPAAESAARAVADDPPVWRIEEDVIAGTRHRHDPRRRRGRPRRRPPAVRGGDASTLTASTPTRPARASTPTSSIAGRSTAFAADDPGTLQPDQRREPHFDLTVDLEVDLDGEPFFERDWHETIPRRLV